MIEAMEQSNSWSIKSWASSWFSFLRTQSQPALAKEVAKGPDTAKPGDDDKEAAALKPGDTVSQLRAKGIDIEIVELKVASQEYDSSERGKMHTKVREAIIDMLAKDRFVLDAQKGDKGLLGRGGMGAVYRMKNTQSKMTYAVKIIDHVGGIIKKNPKSGDIGKLKQEIEPFALAKSREPGAKRLVNCDKALLVYTTFDRGTDKDGKKHDSKYSIGVIVMDYCNFSLRDVYKHRSRERTTVRKFSEKVIASWFFGMAEGLAYLHSKKIAHKDIKPDNVLLQRRPGCQPKANSDDEMDDDAYLLNGFDLKLADYGISKNYGTAHFDAFETAIKGTRSYMAPEMFRPAHERTYAHEPTDIWALGVTIWELVHFQWPFDIPQSTNLEKIDVSVFKVAPRVPRYNAWSKIDRHPPLLEMLLRSCLALDVNYRFTAAQIMQHVYFDILEDDTVDKLA